VAGSLCTNLLSPRDLPVDPEANTEANTEANRGAITADRGLITRILGAGGGLGFGCRYRCRSITGMNRHPPPMTRMNPMTGTNLSRRHPQTFPTILSRRRNRTIPTILRHRHHGMTPTILSRRHLLIVGTAVDLLPALKDEQEVTPVGLSPSSGPGAIVTRRPPDFGPESKPPDGSRPGHGPLLR